MPINGQMTLMDVVAAGQQAQQHAQQQQQYQRQLKAQQNMDFANQAASDVLNNSRAEWVNSGAQGEYSPSDETHMRMAEARGLAFAQNGDYENFLKNEALVAGQRVRVRGNALQRFMSDGDAEALVRAHHATVFDGRRITGIEKEEGAGAVLQHAAKPAGLRVKFSDGSEQFVEPAKLATTIKASLIDPAKAAEMEAEFNLKRALEETKGREARDKIRLEGEETRNTERVKGSLAVAAENVKFGHKQALTEAEIAGRDRVAAGNNKATLGAAALGKEGRVEAAAITADAKDSKKGGAANKIKDFKAVHDEVTRYLGEQSNTLMGSGGRISTEDTQAVASIAKKAIDAGEEPEDAIRQSAAVYFRNKPKGKK